MKPRGRLAVLLISMVLCFFASGAASAEGVKPGQIKTQTKPKSDAERGGEEESTQAYLGIRRGDSDEANKVMRRLRPGKKPLIVCSTTQIADFARQVVGDRCSVGCILAPGADPHTYQPTPRDVELVLKADLCLQNGLHLEGKNWMATLARNAGVPLVTCTDGLEPLKMDYNGQVVSDPHSWFTPANAAVYVNNIVRAAAKLDPAGREEYEARARLYLQQLRALDGWIKEQFRAIPPAKRILVTSHDAFNYFARAYGFQNKAPVGWSTGSEVGGGMTPRQRKAVVDSIRNFGVKAVFVETSVNPKLIREIAAQAGVKIGGELFSDSMGEAGTAGESYIGMMRENVIAIAHALK